MHGDAWRGGRIHRWTMAERRAGSVVDQIPDVSSSNPYIFDSMLSSQDVREYGPRESAVTRRRRRTRRPDAHRHDHRWPVDGRQDRSSPCVRQVVTGTMINPPGILFDDASNYSATKGINRSGRCSTWYRYSLANVILSVSVTARYEGRGPSAKTSRMVLHAGGYNPAVGGQIWGDLDQNAEACRWGHCWRPGAKSSQLAQRGRPQ